MSGKNTNTSAAALNEVLEGEGAYGFNPSDLQVRAQRDSVSTPRLRPETRPRNPYVTITEGPGFSKKNLPPKVVGVDPSMGNNLN